MPPDALGEKTNSFFKWKLGSILHFLGVGVYLLKGKIRFSTISNSPFIWNSAILTITTYPLLYHENELLCESSHMELRLWEMQGPRDLIPEQLPLTKHAQKPQPSSRTLSHLLIFSNIAQLREPKSPFERSNSQCI